MGEDSAPASVTAIVAIVILVIAAMFFFYTLWRNNQGGDDIDFEIKVPKKEDIRNSGATGELAATFGLPQLS